MSCQIGSVWIHTVRLLCRLSNIHLIMANVGLHSEKQKRGWWHAFSVLCHLDGYPWACQDLLPMGNLTSTALEGVSVKRTGRLAEGCGSIINWKALQS